MPADRCPRGWFEIDTGGGCTAWQRDLYDPHEEVSRRIGSCLVTTVGDASVPATLSEPVTLGVYDLNDDSVVMFECENTREAVRMATRITQVG